MIDTWHDRKIGAGKEWAKQIDDNLNEADIILLLVSPDFVDSNYCYDNELKQAMKRHNDGEAVVIPVILRPCDWSGLSFAKLQAFPKDANPISTSEDTDAALLDVEKGIGKVAQALFAKRQQKLQKKEEAKKAYRTHLRSLRRGCKPL